MAMPQASSQTRTIDEQILYRLSLDFRSHELAEALLDRFRCLVGDLPASENHHHSRPGGLYQHSLEVALRALEEFAGTTITERRPDGTRDSFQTARNKPRWQYAAFIAALCHDIGKLLEMELRIGDTRWRPFEEPYLEFVQRCRKSPTLTWKPEREHGDHALLSPSLLFRQLLTPDDIDYLGASRIKKITATLVGSHDTLDTDDPVSRAVSKADQASVERAHPAIAEHPDSKVGWFLRILQEMIVNGEINVNMRGGQVFVSGNKTAVVMPAVLFLVRERLRTMHDITLPENCHLYNLLRNSNLVDADAAGKCVRAIKATTDGHTVSLKALIFPTDKVIPKSILPTLPKTTQFEIDTQPQSEPVEGQE
jgi:Putative helicase